MLMTYNKLVQTKTELFLFKEKAVFFFLQKNVSCRLTFCNAATVQNNDVHIFIMQYSVFLTYVICSCCSFLILNVITIFIQKYVSALKYATAEFMNKNHFLSL